MDRPFTIGFTGARVGMSSECVRAVSRQLGLIANANVVGLHGDCVGADSDFDCLCRLHSIETWMRPCTMDGNEDHRFRAYTQAKPMGKATNPMKRNREIASQCHVLFGCPPTDHEVQRSGSWATIRYARKYGKPTFLFFPSGETEGDFDVLRQMLGASK